MAALVGLVLLATLGPVAASASAEVLWNQPPGPSGVALPSDETAGESSEAWDDFVVPFGTHWRLGAIQVFGTAQIQRGRSFHVRIRENGFRGGFSDSSEQIFSERVPAPGAGDYVLPIAGAPRLEPGRYWISVQAVAAGEEDAWSWLTGPDTPGTEAAVWLSNQTKPDGAEPGFAFQLIGTPTQILNVSSAVFSLAHARFENLGTIVSQPAAIACGLVCEAEFPRGTPLTLTANPVSPELGLTGWSTPPPPVVGVPGPPHNEMGSPGSPTPLVPPCTGSPCSLVLNQDLVLQANFAYLNELTVLRLVRNRRTGHGELLVSLPGEGILNMFSVALSPFDSPVPLPAGIARVPLAPTGPVAKRLRHQGSATVSLSLSFKPTRSYEPFTLKDRVTLVRKLPKKHHRHKPRHRLH